MKQYWTLFALGIFIFFLPFLGFPSSWKTVFLFLAGIAISSIALFSIFKMRALRAHSDFQDPHSEQFHEA